MLSPPSTSPIVNVNFFFGIGAMVEMCSLLSNIEIEQTGTFLKESRVVQQVTSLVNEKLFCVWASQDQDPPSIIPYSLWQCTTISGMKVVVS